MTDPELDTQLATLRARVRRLETRARLGSDTDAQLEAATNARLALEQTLDSMFPILLSYTGANAAFVRTFNEDLELRDFFSGSLPPGFMMNPDFERLAEAESKRVIREDDRLMLALPLDVDGSRFGAAGLVFDRTLDRDSETEALELLDTWAEVLDNYLGSIALSRLKHQLTRRTSNALKSPILDEGLDRAIDVLREEIEFEDMLLVFRQEDDVEGVSLRYKIIQGGQITHDSRAKSDVGVDEFIRGQATAMLGGESTALLSRFGITHFREEVLITGPHDERVLGRVIVTSQRGEFNTFERDLLERFADFLRQRLVDFNREWKHLSLCFPKATVERLLHEPDYISRFLEPKERDVAILYADIAGFTRLSEQVLKEPASIGRLIDTWSERVVEIIWETGGVFDKMVGDCVIAMWGPPFDEDTAQRCCQTAAEAARRIREYTSGLADDPALPELTGHSVGVAVGLNYCRALVGYFGPSDDYTAFSRGMNNTARLQGLAERGEILCMQSFCDAFDDESRFGEARTAKVKNVERGLVFRELLDGEPS